MKKMVVYETYWNSKLNVIFTMLQPIDRSPESHYLKMETKFPNPTENLDILCSAAGLDYFWRLRGFREESILYQGFGPGPVLIWFPKFIMFGPPIPSEAKNPSGPKLCIIHLIESAELWCNFAGNNLNPILYAGSKSMTSLFKGSACLSLYIFCYRHFWMWLIPVIPCLLFCYTEKPAFVLHDSSKSRTRQVTAM